MSDVEIRRARPDDWRLVRAARLAALVNDPEAFRSLYEDEAEQDEDDWRRRADASTWFLAVDEISARPVGCVRRTRDDDAPAGDHLLASLWVARPHRGSGLVERLVDAAADDARAAGGHRLTLWVTRDNLRAISAYEKLGFDRVPVPPGLEGHVCAGEIHFGRHLRRRADVTVRRIVDRDDWRLIRDVRLAALRTDPEAFHSTYAVEARYTEADWRRRAGGGELRVAVDTFSGTVLGCLGTFEEPGAPPGALHLFGMWVAPAARGRGVARRLLEAAAEEARAQGSDRLTLWVVRANERARTAYAGLGFVDEEPPPGVRDYRPEGEVRMAFRVPPAD